MSMDRTLKGASGVTRTRSVLTRAERIARMSEEGKFDPEGDSPLGLAKTRVRTSKAGGKGKKDKPAEAAEGAAKKAE